MNQQPDWDRIQSDVLMSLRCLRAAWEHTGVGSRCVVGQVDTRDGVIVETPPIWRKFKGQALHRLEWWLAAKYGTVQKRSMGV